MTWCNSHNLSHKVQIHRSDSREDKPIDPSPLIIGGRCINSWNYTGHLASRDNAAVTVQKAQQPHYFLQSIKMEASHDWPLSWVHWAPPHSLYRVLFQEPQSKAKRLHTTITTAVQDFGVLLSSLQEFHRHKPRGHCTIRGPPLTLLPSLMQSWRRNYYLAQY